MTQALVGGTQGAVDSTGTSLATQLSDRGPASVVVDASARRLLELIYITLIDIRDYHAGVAPGAES